MSDGSCFSQKHLQCLGSRLVDSAPRERYGSDQRVDRGKTVGNSLSSVGKERDGSDNRVGNSLGRAPLGRSPRIKRLIQSDSIRGLGAEFIEGQCCILVPHLHVIGTCIFHASIL